MSDELSFDVVGAHGPRAYFERVTQDSIAHAYVFSGSDGVGKKTFARRLGQSLLCAARKPGVLGYDRVCPSCRLFTAQAYHPDFLEHDGTLKIGERDAPARFGDETLTARDLVRQLSMESYVGGMRVLLLGDLDFATHHAANALLKFFEEPPKGVVLLVTTSSPGKLLPTIRSRAMEIRFGLLSRGEVAEILRRKGYDASEAEAAARLSQGSVTQATAALETQEASVRTQAASWFFDVVTGGTPQEGWASRETLVPGLEVLKGLVRDWVAVHETQLAPLYADYDDRLRSLPPLSGEALGAILSRIDDAQRLARSNVSPSMASEIVRMALCGAAASAEC